MAGLYETQRAFAADLWGEDLHEARCLFLDDRIPAARRFNVYRNNFLASLTDALAALYPVVERLVGSEFFATLADDYVREYPSCSGNVTDFGSTLADFLARYEAVAKLRYLVDVARLERAYHEVFHAAGPPTFDPLALQRYRAEEYAGLHFRLGPACQLVCSMYPVFRIWSVNQHNHEGEESVSLAEGAQSVVVVRPDLEVELWRINSAETSFLEKLNLGCGLGEAVDEALRCQEDFDLQATLTKYLSSGALVLVE